MPEPVVKLGLGEASAILTEGQVVCALFPVMPFAALTATQALCSPTRGVPSGSGVLWSALEGCEVLCSVVGCIVLCRFVLCCGVLCSAAKSAMSGVNKGRTKKKSLTEGETFLLVPSTTICTAGQCLGTAVQCLWSVVKCW